MARTPSFLSDAVRVKTGALALVNGRTGRPIATAFELATTSETRRKGLLGRDSLDPSAAMIIAPCSSVHTFFMRFPIDIIFVRRDGTIRKIVRNVRPWRIAGSLGTFATIEMAGRAVDLHDLRVGDRVSLNASPPASAPGTGAE